MRWSVSEQILNGTSAQLGYTVPFTLVQAGKYRTEDRFKMWQKVHKLNTTQKKANNTKHSKTKLPCGSVSSYDTRPGNETGLL